MCWWYGIVFRSPPIRRLTNMKQETLSCDKKENKNMWRIEGLSRQRLFYLSYLSILEVSLTGGLGCCNYGVPANCCCFSFRGVTTRCQYICIHFGKKWRSRDARAGTFVTFATVWICGRQFPQRLPYLTTEKHDSLIPTFVLSVGLSVFCPQNEKLALWKSTLAVNTGNV